MNILKNTSLFQNIFSIAVLQGVSFCLTLLFIPFLTRMVGLSGFGELVFTQVIINIFIWITNWGFYLGATQRIAAAKKNVETVQDIFNSTWFAQLFLTLISIFLYIVVIYVLPNKDILSGLYAAGILMIIGNALFPIWFLNGMELIKISVIFQIIGKVFSLIITIAFVDGEEQSWIYILSLGLSFFISGFMTFVFMKVNFEFQLIAPKIKDITNAMHLDFHLFLGSISSSANSNIIPVSLGLFGSPELVGIYNLADRARGAGTMVFMPVAHALFPRMCHLVANDPVKASDLLRRSTTFQIVIALIISSILYVFAEQIVLFLGGGEFASASGVLKILSIAIVANIICNIIIHQVVIPSGFYSIYLKSIILTFCITSIFVWPVVTITGINGCGYLAVFSEFILLYSLWRGLSKKTLFYK